MRIKDMRQGLHMLLHTQGTDGLSCINIKWGAARIIETPG